MSKNPEIRINFSWLFYEDISKQIFKLQGWDLPSAEKCEEWTENYRQAWAKKEKAILSAMHEITGLTFYTSVIDVIAAPGVIPKNEPVLINFYNDPKMTVDVITHELTHKLLCDNTTFSMYGEDRDFMLGYEWQELFGFKDDFEALIHVPVHAIQQKIFEDYLGDKEFVSRDRAILKELGADSYLKAWDYVEREGADVIIDKLKKSYAGIPKKLEKKK